MNWLVAIDIRIWKSDFFMLEKILSYAKAKPWLKVLYTDDLNEMISTNYSESWLIYNVLSAINLIKYSKRPVDTSVKFSPNILEGLNESEKDATENIAYYMLHQGEPPHKLYNIYQLEGNNLPSNTLTLRSEKHSRNIELIIESQGQNIELYFNQNKPK